MNSDYIQRQIILARENGYATDRQFKYLFSKVRHGRPYQEQGEGKSEDNFGKHSKLIQLIDDEDRREIANGILDILKYGYVPAKCRDTLEIFMRVIDNVLVQYQYRKRKIVLEEPSSRKKMPVEDED